MGHDDFNRRDARLTQAATDIARYEIAYDDGGSVEYIGLFYKVYFVHQICGGKWENTKAFHNKRYVIFQKVGPWFEGIGAMIDREYEKYEKIDEAASE